MKIVFSKPNKFYLLTAILSAAAILRFHQIDQPFIDCVNWRETDTASIADNFYRGNWNIFYPEISWNGPEPNYVGYEFQTVTYIAALLYRLVGQHDWVGRTVAVLFGLWSIFAFYQLVRRVWDEKHALASAAILAILPGSIYVDRSFLPDPVMVSLVVTSFWLLVVYLQTERISFLLLASLIGMWGFLTKITGIFVGIPMLYVIITMLAQKRMLRSKQLALICVTAILTLVPVAAYYIWAHYISLTYPPHHIAASGNWLWNSGLSQWWEQKYFLPKLYTLNPLWTKPALMLFVAGLFLRPPQSDRNSKLKQQQNRFGKAPWLFHWWILAIVIYYLIGAQQLVDNPHNLNIIHPAVAALTGHAIVAITSFTHRRVGTRASVAIVAAILLIVSGFASRNLKAVYSSPFAEQGYELGLALRQTTQPNDLVVTISQEIGNPISVYYSQRRGWVFPPALPGIKWSTSDDLNNNSKAIRLLKELRAKGADWLGIVNQRKIKLWQDNPKLAEYIEQTFELHQESPEWVIYRILPDK